MPALVGLGGGEAGVGGAGSFARLGTTSPASCRTRGMVEVDDGLWPSWWRCQAIVTGPASSPSLVRCRRSATIRSRTLFGVAAGVRRRPPRAWFDCVQPVVAVAGQQPVQVLMAVAVLRRCGGDGQFVAEDFKDSNPGFRHARHFDRRYHPCRDSGVTYLLSSMS